MKCCANCFGDSGLRKEISYRSTEVGTCSYCESEDAIIIDPKKLEDKFATLINTYELNDAGMLLAEWLKKDWSLFSHEKMSNSQTQVLLGDILDDGQIVRKLFIPAKQYESDRLGRWKELRSELMHENRFFPKTIIDLKRLELLLSRLVFDVEELPNTWYRARIKNSERDFSKDEMHAPPPKIASHGRANPAGIPYLYLGSQIGTAISEIRPHTGEVASVADFKIPSELSLVDLRDPRSTASPFLLADEEDVGQMRFDLSFLEKLGEELTRPVRPHAVAYDYTPSQYLCEFIKQCRYDGVVYRSSVSKGINLALFYPKKAIIGMISLHSVDQVLVKASIIN